MICCWRWNTQPKFERVCKLSRTCISTLNCKQRSLTNIADFYFNIEINNQESWQHIADEHSNIDINQHNITRAGCAARTCMRLRRSHRRRDTGVGDKNTPPDKKTGWKISSALKAPNLGLDCSFCCWVARPRLKWKECFVHRHRRGRCAGALQRKGGGTWAAIWDTRRSALRMSGRLSRHRGLGMLSFAVKPSIARGAKFECRLFGTRLFFEIIVGETVTAEAPGHALRTSPFGRESLKRSKPWCPGA